METVKMGHAYPLASGETPPSRAREPRKVRAMWTGEKRPPKRGEWFLSGAIVEAYKAPNDLTHPHLIAVLVQPVETVTTWEHM